MSLQSSLWILNLPACRTEQTEPWIPNPADVPVLWQFQVQRGLGNDHKRTQEGNKSENKYDHFTRSEIGCARFGTAPDVPQYFSSCIRERASTLDIHIREFLYF